MKRNKNHASESFPTSLWTPNHPWCRGLLCLLVLPALACGGGGGSQPPPDPPGPSLPSLPPPEILGDSIATTGVPWSGEVFLEDIGARGIGA